MQMIHLAESKFEDVKFWPIENIDFSINALKKLLNNT